MIISKRTPRISLRNAGSLGSLSCALVLCAASLVAKDHGTKQATAAGQEHFRFEAVSDKSLEALAGRTPCPCLQPWSDYKPERAESPGPIVIFSSDLRP